MSQNPLLPSGDAQDDWLALLTADGPLFEDLNDDDFADLGDDLLKPSEELGRVSRRIAAQYAEVLTSFAAQAFAGRAGSASLDQVEAAIESLARLARAASDEPQVAMLNEVRQIIGPATTGKRNSRSRQSALVALRDWIPRFAASLEEEDAQRLMSLVEWNDSAAPLMDELSTIRGIGPKRLQRLYAAGLYTVDVVATASPDDVAAVTGLPHSLAVKVIAATRNYAVDERRRLLESLRERALRLRHILASVPMDDDLGLQQLATDALREVETTFRSLHNLEDPS